MYETMLLLFTTLLFCPLIFEGNESREIAPEIILSTGREVLPCHRIMVRIQRLMRSLMFRDNMERIVVRLTTINGQKDDNIG